MQKDWGVIQYGTEAVDAARVERILPRLRRKGFRDACHTISAVKDYPNVQAGRLKEALYRELKGKEEVLDYFLDYLSTEEDPTLLIYAVWCTEGVENRQLQELYVELMDKYRTYENTKFDYKGSQMVLKGGACLGASRPEGQLTSNLMRQFDYFGLDYRGGFKLLMDEDRWKERIWGIVKVSERDFFYKSPPPNRRHVFRDAKCVRQTFMGDDAFSCRAHGVY